MTAQNVTVAIRNSNSGGGTATTAVSFSLDSDGGVSGHRVLVVTVHSEDNNATAATRQAVPSSVTYNSVAMTKQTSDFNDDGTFANVTSIWTLAAPAFGTNTVAVNYAVAKDNVAVHAVVVEGASSATAEAVNQGNGSGTSASLSVTSTSADAVIFYAAGQSGTGGMTESNLTELVDTADPGPSCRLATGWELGVSSPGSNTGSWSWTGSARYAWVAISLPRATIQHAILNSASNTAAASTTNSFSYSCTGGTTGMRKLVVFCAHQDNDATAGTRQADPTSITYNGVALTKRVGQIHDSAGVATVLSVWSLDEPATGSNTLVATWAVAKDNSTLTALMVDRVVPGAPEVTNSGTFTSSSSIASAATTVSTLAVFFSGLLCTATTGGPTPQEGHEWTETSATILTSVANDEGPSSPGSNTVTWTTSVAKTGAQVALAWAYSDTHSGAQDATKTILYTTPAIGAGLALSPAHFVFITPSIGVGLAPTAVIEWHVGTALADSFDHEPAAINRLPLQYASSARLQSLAAIVGRRIQQLRGQARQVHFLRSLEFAVDDRLDQLGTVLGLTRGSKTDGQYRMALSAQIFSLISTGSIESILRVALELWGSSATITVTETGDASVTIDVLDGDPAFTEFYETILAGAKPLGVALTLTFS